MSSAAASSIAVTIRVRPFNVKESTSLSENEDGPVHMFSEGSLSSNPGKPLGSGRLRRIVKVLDERVLVFDPPESNPLGKFQKSLLPAGKRVKDMRYAFDRVFDETASQEEASVLEGYNATIFAYGATGCGKTHTISGNPSDPGIIFLTMKDLFTRMNMNEDSKVYDVSLSYLEIYNETIKDLLVPYGTSKSLLLREDADKRINVPGLTCLCPKNVEEVMDAIMSGNANRTQSPTEANQTSSRSHAVLQINVSQRDRTADICENHSMATLSIIDLAGSERASVTKNKGERLIEGANINRSLLALGNCINALCDPHRRSHVPYRDSKLTRLLKFSLGGNCKTVMIVCISPSSQHYDETHNTLKYGNRAKNIKTKVSRNVVSVDRHVSGYVKAIYELRQEVEELKKKLVDSSGGKAKELEKFALQKESLLKDALNTLDRAWERSLSFRTKRLELTRTIRKITLEITTLSSWLQAFQAAARTESTDMLKHQLQSAISALESQAETRRKEFEQLPSVSDNLTSALSLQLAELEKFDDQVTLRVIKEKVDMFSRIADIEEETASVSAVESEFNVSAQNTKVLGFALYECLNAMEPGESDEDERMQVIRRRLATESSFQRLASVISGNSFDIKRPQKGDIPVLEDLSEHTFTCPIKSPRRPASRHISKTNSPRSAVRVRMNTRKPVHMSTALRRKSPAKKRVRFDGLQSASPSDVSITMDESRGEMDDSKDLGTGAAAFDANMSDTFENSSSSSSSFNSSGAEAKASTSARPAIAPIRMSAHRAAQRVSSGDEKSLLRSDKENSFEASERMFPEKSSMASNPFNAPMRLSNPGGIVREVKHDQPASQARRQSRGSDPANRRESLLRQSNTSRPWR